MKSVVAILTVVCLPTIAWAAPGAAGAGRVLAEYCPATGELIVSSGGAVNFFVQSASNRITPLNPAPVPPVGLLTNNSGRIGITNLGPINLTDYSFGSIGKNLAQSDLTLNYTPALGQKAIVVAAGSEGFRCIPEPSSLGLITAALIPVSRLRRYLIQGSIR